MALNYSVFLKEVCARNEMAIRLAKTAFDDAVDDLVRKRCRAVAFVLIVLVVVQTGCVLSTEVADVLTLIRSNLTNWLKEEEEQQE